MLPHKLIAEVDDRGRAMRIAGALQDLIEPPPDALAVIADTASNGGNGLWRVEAYFQERREASVLGAEVEALLGEVIPPFRSDDIPDLNWVAISQAALPPVHARRFTVHGSHDRDRVPQGPNAILIEAGEAFGTAHHATTFGCLMAIERVAATRRPAHILDLGCGSGILAIAAARAWPHAAILGVDIDEQAIVVARENARSNGAGARIDFVAGAGFAVPQARRAAPFNFIIANILAEPLVGLAPDLRRNAAPGGLVLLSGLLNREAARVSAAYVAQGFSLLAHQRYDGWSTLLLCFRTP